MLIANYGLFWKREDVFWGSPNNSGSLLGVPAQSRSFGPVDFREQAGIYVLYANFHLVYVGQTGGANQKLLFRLNQHRRDHLAGRWDTFSWFGTRVVLADGALKAEKVGANTDHKTVLDHVEAILIHAAEPALNRQGGRWGPNVEQFLQYRDDRLPRPMHEMIKDLHHQVVSSVEQADSQAAR